MKPKKMLILAVAVVLGLMAGMFVALIRKAMQNRRQQKREHRVDSPSGNPLKPHAPTM
ncbi:hypothetical protein [Methylomarinum roseum]|uniref:hypothetical protein n=1 Tax=Methylomarinum roseum TaxID=3067653 RepID=UPI003D7E6B23